MAKGDTVYSETVPGAHGNYGWDVRFDMTNGFLGLTQWEGDRVKDRVLMSPKQVKELVAFMGKTK